MKSCQGKPTVPTGLTTVEPSLGAELRRGALAAASLRAGVVPFAVVLAVGREVQRGGDVGRGSG